MEPVYTKYQSTDATCAQQPRTLTLTLYYQYNSMFRLSPIPVLIHMLCTSELGCRYLNWSQATEESSRFTRSRIPEKTS
ncbi:UNVERIFIED_CONTAM: hypothetical protein NCL1_16610 [Trichonephila clavipes]